MVLYYNSGAIYCVKWQNNSVQELAKATLNTTRCGMIGFARNCRQMSLLCKPQILMLTRMDTEHNAAGCFLRLNVHHSMERLQIPTLDLFVPLQYLLSITSESQTLWRPAEPWRGCSNCCNLYYNHCTTHWGAMAQFYHIKRINTNNNYYYYFQKHAYN